MFFKPGCKLKLAHFNSGPIYILDQNMVGGGRGGGAKGLF
jgi:hypothetical protein